MTTSPTYPNETWLPLGAEGRTWESIIPSSSSSTKAFPNEATLSSGDFAVEAGYSRPQRLTPGITHQNQGAGPRHDPPIIKEEHVWGVADEWGDKAGKWGKGPRVYKNGKK
jgi:protein AFG1